MGKSWCVFREEPLLLQALYWFESPESPRISVRKVSNSGCTICKWSYELRYLGRWGKPGKCSRAVLGGCSLSPAALVCCCSETGTCWHRTGGQMLLSLAPVLISCKLWLQTTVPAAAWSVDSFQGGTGRREIKTELQGRGMERNSCAFLFPQGLWLSGPANHQI